MQQLSLVTAKIVRENAQYAYKLVGKGEKYLVRHQDGDNAGAKVMEYLAPYAKEPVVIEAVALQKNIEFLNPDNTKDNIYKCVIEYHLLNEDTGKETKVRKGCYVYATSPKEVIDIIDEHTYFADSAVTSISLTKIIELL